MTLQLVFLGTGTSAGIPMIGCDCDVCRSDDPRDRRDRPSVLIRYPRPRKDSIDDRPCQLLIDTTQDLRLQAIRHDVNHLDGVLYTHGHADHVFGLDDLRRFNAVMHRPIDIYAEHRVLNHFSQMFGYIFEPHRNVNDSFVATLTRHELHAGEPIDLLGATWTPLRLIHGKLPILGFRVDRAGASLAYCTDVSAIPDETYPLLEDLDVLVIDALRYRPHPTHLTVGQALAEIDTIQPRRAYFIHMAHDVKHADLAARLPDGVELSHDGLVVDVTS